MNAYIYPYQWASQSAKSIAGALDIKRIRLENSKFKGHPNTTVINWGCRELPAEPRNCKVINHSVFVEAASNKLKFFDLMVESGNREIIPPYTRDRAVAEAWLQPDQLAYSSTVVCRTHLRGHSGKGIVMAEKPEDMIDAPLYTQYIPKKQEYRVYICGQPNQGEVIDVARKARRIEHNAPNWKIRSWHNGFVFARQGCNPPQAVLDAAQRAHDATCLHFSAVDVVYNDRHKRAFVLEINTAPGIEGQTIGVYADALKKIID